ncbi:hypothetical protein EDD17DRAFT_1542510 [Pisolithus thermaeus]|nr:hypothetical protein EDD17DRAFT_1542510 [Pisolithus thermaeus]
MGMKDAIFDARSDYENVWFGLSMEGIKLKDLISGWERKRMRWSGGLGQLQHDAGNPATRRLCTPYCFTNSPFISVSATHPCAYTGVTVRLLFHFSSFESGREHCPVFPVPATVNSYPFQRIVYDTSPPLALIIYTTSVITHICSSCRSPLRPCSSRESLSHCLKPQNLPKMFVLGLRGEVLLTA